MTETFIERIEKYDHKINAVVVKTFEEAIEAAKSADKDISQNKIKGPLHGVPMTIKESYNIKGESTNWGIPDFKNNIAKKDSLAVQRLSLIHI